MYTVEIFSGKQVWEIAKETVRQIDALRFWEDCIVDGYNARITFERDGQDEWRREIYS